MGSREGYGRKKFIVSCRDIAEGHQFCHKPEGDRGLDIHRVPGFLGLAPALMVLGGSVFKKDESGRDSSSGLQEEWGQGRSALQSLGP